MRVLRYFARAYPWQSLGVVLCLGLAALAEGIGLSTLLPLLSIATGVDAGSLGLASGYEGRVVAALGRFGLEPRLAPLLALVVAAIWAKGLLVLLSKRQVGTAVAHVATDLRRRLMGALLGARWPHFTRQPLGGIVNAVASEADRASRAYEQLALIVTYAVEATVYVALAFAVSWRATLAAGAAGLATAALLAPFVRMAGSAGRAQTRLLQSLAVRVTDALHAVKLFKATGREAAVGPLLERDALHLDRALRRRVLAREGLRALQEPILVTLVAAGVFLARTRAALPIASVFLLVLVFARTLLKINAIQNKAQGMAAEASALWSIAELTRRAEREGERRGGAVPPRLEHAVEIRDVAVAFDGRAVLEGLSLTIPAGRITALIGPSGAGKTTISDLVSGLVAPDAGAVRIDGVDLATLDLHAWRRQIGFVPQETLLLHESVRANVTLGDPALRDADVEAALRDAGAWELVRALPEGLDTSVGERGARLSGGQRQRIALARALVHAPRLLILDEATAALDAESEAAVWATLARLRGRTAILAISHQPGVADRADRVYRVEGGRALRADRAPREVA